MPPPHTHTHLREHTSRKDTNCREHALGMHLIYPLTKGHLSNEDKIVGRTCVPIRGGLLCIYFGRKNADAQ